MTPMFNYLCKPQGTHTMDTYLIMKDYANEQFLTWKYINYHVENDSLITLVIVAS